MVVRPEGGDISAAPDINTITEVWCDNERSRHLAGQRPFKETLIHGNGKSLVTRLLRAGFFAALVTISLAVSPREAKAASKVCAPDNRGCYYTRARCSDVYRPKGWSCAAALKLTKPEASEQLVRERDGRAYQVAEKLGAGPQRAPIAASEHLFKSAIVDLGATVKLNYSAANSPSSFSATCYAFVNGKKFYLLSEKLEAQFARKRPTADEFARLVLSDAGSVAEADLQQLRTELGLPVKGQAGAKR